MSCKVKQKTVIAFKGAANQGKTTVIKKMVELMNKKYGTTIEIPDTGDFKEDFNIGGCKIGVGSQGDDRNSQGIILQKFKEASCDIIICACRTRRGTVNNIEKLKESGYRIVWVKTYGISDHQFLEKLNSIFAKNQLDLFEEILNGSI